MVQFLEPILRKKTHDKHAIFVKKPELLGFFWRISVVSPWKKHCSSLRSLPFSYDGDHLDFLNNAGNLRLLRH